MKSRGVLLLGALLLLWFLLPGPGWGKEAAPLLARIKAVGKEGAGNKEAATAWKELVRLGPGVLLEVLAAIDDTNPRAANWLTSAVDAIAEDAFRKKALPVKELEKFVKDRRHAGTARRLAYEWLVRVDPGIPGRLLPGMLDDPGLELRRDAVAVVLKQAQDLLAGKDREAARAAFQKALQYARDRDQVMAIAGGLKKLGVEVDLNKQFGIVTRWWIAAPFDNSGGKGFSRVFPPEKGVDLKASYQGKDDKPVRWQEHTTSLSMGLVDLNKVIGPLHGATAFAYVEVDSPVDQAVELRAASNNAVRLFLNGREVYFREEYHHGMKMDQHVGRGKLKAGLNRILVKVCQNEQTEDWAQQWSFLLRLCDPLGGAVAVKIK